ncbi:hypothetical protein CesoFtcFv8_015351 [Champsocephalus esox]|uniref:Uncharacterized protein n=1 Tax=Champsocephalus esox TaxID=159716 RepID=A0AAN8BRI6_9TELE|nr:hypothetical protein CesoFtcFv8_015351 [Champsocephalus esox]
MLLRHSLCPSSQIYLIKNPGTQTEEQAVMPSKTFSCPLTDSQTEQMSNHRFQEYLASLRPCLSPGPTGKCMCCSRITLTPPFLLTLSYY